MVIDPTNMHQNISTKSGIKNPVLNFTTMDSSELQYMRGSPKNTGCLERDFVPLHFSFHGTLYKMLVRMVTAFLP